jgi:Domain of unknown function (DUF5127)
VDNITRNYFARNGTLDNQFDQNVNVSGRYAVFAIARDLGTIQVTQAPIVWAVGHTTDPAINFADLSGAPPTPRSPYYKTQYSTDEALASIETNSCGNTSDNKVQIIDFLKDFNNASLRAQQLDNKILQDAGSVSNNLGGLVSFAIAQVYGSMQLTIASDAQRNVYDPDVMMFMKNIGGVEAK